MKSTCLFVANRCNWSICTAITNALFAIPMYGSVAMAITVLIHFYQQIPLLQITTMK